jgi:hypothetical protein
MPRRKAKSIDVDGVGTVKFRPLGRVAMRRVRNAARRIATESPGDGRKPRLRGLSKSVAIRSQEDALLVVESVIERRSRKEEMLREFRGRGHLLVEVANAIRGASWPHPVGR